MALPKSQIRFTVEQYLKIERQFDERLYYLDGEIYSMVGESPNHGTISTNLIMIVASQLKGSRCQAWSKDFKVRSGPSTDPAKSTKGLYSFPDLVVFCGEPQFHDEHRDVLINPTVVIEVLSPSTEAFDRGEKFLRYQNWNPTLTDYLLVSQTQHIIEHYTRQDDGSWSYFCYQELANTLTIKSIECSLNLAEVYDRIDFSVENSDLN